MADRFVDSISDEMNQPSRIHYLQIEVIKTLMISLVIIDHVLPHLTKSMLFIQFWLRLSVPIFLIVMGFNYGHSFHYKGQTSAREIYSRDYFNRKLRRYALPFLVLFIPLTLVVIVLDQFEIRVFSSRAIFPFWGPGVWYIPVVLSAVLVLPVLYSLFIKKPHLTVALCFTSDLIMHLLLYFLLESTQSNAFTQDIIRFLFQSNVLFYLSAVALGFWFSTGYDLFSKKNRFIWVILPFSLMYIILYEFVGWRPLFIISDYNFMMIPYSAIIFLIFMKLLPEKSQGLIANIFTRTGRSTYHILLVQTVMFSVLYHFIPDMLIGEIVFNIETYLILCVVIIVISFIIGIIWQEAERKRETSLTINR